jgi:hypothetical protein
MNKVDGVLCAKLLVVVTIHVCMNIGELEMNLWRFEVVDEGFGYGGFVVVLVN